MTSSDPHLLLRHLALAAPEDGACRAVVLVRDGRVLSVGVRLGSGGPHPALTAVETAAEGAAGAFALAVLGSCDTCREALRAAQVAVLREDPDPPGGDVADAAAMARRARDLGRPFVTLTAAMTWDGKIASRARDSKWISSEASLLDTHRLRSLHRAILVGSGTVAADNPRLSSRIPGGRNPIRVVLDSRLRTPLEAHLASDAAAPTWIFTAAEPPGDRADRLRTLGVDIVPTSGRTVVSLPDVLRTVWARGVDSVLVEGGGTVHAAFFEAGLVDQVVLYLAPKLVGGRDAPTFLEGEGRGRMAEALDLEAVRVAMLGPDLRLVGRPARPGESGGAPVR